MADAPFLHLLLEEADAEDFEKPVQEALQRGATEEEVAALRSAAATALQIRTVLAQRRRREAELAALYETAGDLTSLRDVEAVLQALVQRARRLLGTDVAYLTLFDEDRGDTYMRVTDGIATEAFRRLRLSMGTGLGGLVAQTRAPYATANYLVDERFAHTGGIDDAVNEEGLIAILGVPLQIAGRVIGVLFTANRHERPFAPEEVTLLSSLAAHAAIAIQNARLFGETQDALAELAATSRLLREHSEAVERAAAAHEGLTSLVLQGAGAGGLAEELAGSLAAAVRLVDSEGRTLGVAGETPDPQDLRAPLEEARRVGRTIRAAHTPPCWVAPIMAGPDHLGAIILSGRDHLAGVDLRIVERGAQVSALLLLNEQSIAEAEQRVRGELLDDLLSGPRGDVDSLRRRLRMAGVDLEAGHTVVVAHAGAADRHRAGQAAAALASDYGGLGGEHNGNAVLLLPDTDSGAAARLVGERLRAALGPDVTAGAAGPASGTVALVSAYGQAHRCVRILQAMGRPGAAAGVEELGVFAMLLGEAGRNDLEVFLEHRLGPIFDYDRRRRTDLLGTLRAYFDAGGNHARAAAALHVHVNTLYQRFERVAQLLGADWQEPDNALQIHLAVQIADLQRALA